jgi:hypothetical protein
MGYSLIAIFLPAARFGRDDLSHRIITILIHNKMMSKQTENIALKANTLQENNF